MKKPLRDLGFQAIVFLLLALQGGRTEAHPGSGIVVDDAGRVWFMDTGFGLWQIDASGRLSPFGGPGGHFLAIDRRAGFQHGHFGALELGDVEISRVDPTLLVGTSYPIAVGADGALYFPQVARKGRVRIMRMEPGEEPSQFAELPEMREIGYDGKPVDAEWIWGLAAGPNGSLYYTEQQAVRRVAADGMVSTIAEHVTVPDCERPEGARRSHSDTGLYGLDVAADGTVYVAAAICSAVLKIDSNGEVSVALRSTDRWSPQGVALDGSTLYVLEYDMVDSHDRADWMPRVRRLDADGTVSIVAEVDERPKRADAGLRELPIAAYSAVLSPPRSHAAMVHFPIVLFFVSLPIAAWSVFASSRVGPRLQLFVLFAGIVLFGRLSESTGERASRLTPVGTDGVPGVTWEVMRAHTNYAAKLVGLAWLGLVTAGASLVPISSRLAGAFRVSACCASLLTAITGSAVAIATAHFGGELVYGQGVGSDTLERYLREKFRSNTAAMRQVALLESPPTDQSAVDDFAGGEAGAERGVWGIPLCWCPPGRFTFGSPRSEPERRPGELQVDVTISRGFWMGKFEVTQGNWLRVMNKLPGELTAELPEGDDYPVGNVNFAEAEAFCAKLTELARQASELPAGWEFRLPTEAQWEYACRAGTTTATSFGDSLSSTQANFRGDKPYGTGALGPTLGKAAKVGQYAANPWGLHDMHGNTCEWCRDWFNLFFPGGVDPDLHDAQATATKNRTGDLSRSRRGSCWADPGWAGRSAFRQRFEPERRYDHIGFRIVAVPL